MRRGSEPKFVADIGVDLSADFTAEHEWGIKGLQQAFGITNELSIYGLEKRIIRNVPDTLGWISGDTDKGHTEGFFFTPYDRDGAQILKHYGGELTTWRNTLAAAWSDGDFAVVSSDKSEQEKLRTIFERILAKDAAIFLAGGGAFQNAGLKIAIASKLPKETLEMWETSDRDAHEIRQEVEASGIEKELASANCRYFALSPRRKDGKLIFWLNPMEQQRNNFGWFDLDALRQWAKGTGPIPMQKVSA